MHYLGNKSSNMTSVMSGTKAIFWI